MENVFSVFVGGAEVNDNYVNKTMAENIADDYVCDGYDDVVIVEMNTQLSNVINETKMK